MASSNSGYRFYSGQMSVIQSVGLGIGRSRQPDRQSGETSPAPVPPESLEKWLRDTEGQPTERYPSAADRRSYLNKCIGAGTLQVEHQFSGRNDLAFRDENHPPGRIRA